MSSPGHLMGQVDRQPLPWAVLALPPRRAALVLEGRGLHTSHTRKISCGDVGRGCPDSIPACSHLHLHLLHPP